MLPDEPTKFNSPMPVKMDGSDYAESTFKLMPIKLNTVHRKIMQYDIMGKRPGEIGELVGMTLSRISVIMNSGLYQVEKKRMQAQFEEMFVEKTAEDEVHKLFTDEALKSAQALVALRDGAKNESVKHQSAIALLDRAGYKVPKEEAESSTPVEVSEELANTIRTALAVMQQKIVINVNGVAVAQEKVMPKEFVEAMQA